MVERVDVERAARVVEGRVHRTPVLSATGLHPAVRLKAELFQRTGSFKVRGVLNRLAVLEPEEAESGVISVSAGNHAQALAWGAASLGISALLVTWRSADPVKVAATEGYGGVVDREAADPSEAFERLEELRAATGRVLVHPYDDPLVVAGQGTVGLELLEDVPGLCTVVVPVGGGGLVAGITAACAPAGVRVVGVEPEGSRALGAALEAGTPVPVTPRSIADALNAPFAGALATELCLRHGVEVVTVSDEEIEDAFRWLYGRAKLACEPGAAAAAAAVVTGRVEIDGPTAVVVSGGNVGAKIASGILGRP